jgi:hypothetical protein
MQVDVGGGKARPGHVPLATDQKLKAILEHTFGKKPWKAGDSDGGLGARDSRGPGERTWMTQIEEQQKLRVELIERFGEQTFTRALEMSGLRCCLQALATDALSDLENGTTPT